MDSHPRMQSKEAAKELRSCADSDKIPSVPAGSLGLMSAEDRYDVWSVKSAERPGLLTWSKQETTEGVDNDGDVLPLVDGCDVPGWRRFNLAGIEEGEDDGILNVGSGCTMLRRESQVPTMSLRRLARWEALKERLMEPLSSKQMPVLSMLDVLNLKSSSPWFEVHNFPVAFEEECTAHWGWRKHEDIWQFLIDNYGDHTWRCSDTHAEGLSLVTYNTYCKSLEGRIDDAPLAVYDSQFHLDERAELLDQYNVWPCFDQESRDIFTCCEDSGSESGSECESSSTSAYRPPYRWILMGPARSGTGLHVDPLGTHAWVTLLQGCKRWVLFSPKVDRNILHMSTSDDNADAAIPSAIWFANHYEEVTEELRQQQQKKNGDDDASALFVEYLQRPGETVYVPAGWPHLVLNLDDRTVAITHNYASEYPSLERLMDCIQREEPTWMTEHLLPQLKQRNEELHRRIQGFLSSPPSSKAIEPADTDSTSSSTS